jgi:hypothetical protein
MDARDKGGHGAGGMARFSPERDQDHSLEKSPMTPCRREPPRKGARCHHLRRCGIGTTPTLSYYPSILMRRAHTD